MSITETKNELHHLIDSINDQQILSKVYDVVSRSVSREEDQLWNTLSEAEKEEVLQSYYESMNEENLIPHEEMKKKYKKWLKK